MNICAKSGTKVRFSGENGHKREREHARAILEIGEEYTVGRIKVGNWSSRVVLAEFPNRQFNTVMFEEVSQ